MFVGATISRLWQAGPWDLPKPGRGREAAPAAGSGGEPPRFELASTRNIIEKNLFDPERGAGRSQQTEASAVAAQRIRSMTLLGTAILGDSRYAIMQSPSASRAPATKSQPGNSGQMRLKLGDTLEGFRLSEIGEKKVVFTRGASRVEVTMDFSLPVEAPRPGAPLLPRPPAAPRAESRGVRSAETAPQTPARQDNSTQGQKASRIPETERQLQPPQQPDRRPPQRVPSKEEAAPAQSP